LAATAGGVYLLFKRQDKYGLYDKTKNFNQIFIFPKDSTTKDFYKMAQTKNKHLIFHLSATITEKIIGILMFFSGSMEILLSELK
jgi:hypothetical protein